MRIVDAEDPDAAIDPDRVTPSSAFHSARQCRTRGRTDKYLILLRGFSAYLMVPSGRWRNHSGCSRTTGDRRRLPRQIERHFETEALGLGPKPRSLSACEPGVDGRGTPAGEPRPMDCRDAGAATSALLRFAEARADRVDGRQVTTSKSRSAMRGSSAAASRKVPRRSRRDRPTGKHFVQRAEIVPLAVTHTAAYGTSLRATDRRREPSAQRAPRRARS